MKLTEILHNEDQFTAHIRRLRSKAPLYPQIYYEEKGGAIWATCLVMFMHNDRKYLRHHVESIIPNPEVGYAQLTNKIVDATGLTIQYGIPTANDTPVFTNQQSNMESNLDGELKSAAAPRTKSVGEQRVRTEFNASGSSVVDQIKQKSAELINLCEELKVKDGRLASLAQTTYEEAAMWAVKAATA